MLNLRNLAAGCLVCVGGFSSQSKSRAAGEGARPTHTGQTTPKAGFSAGLRTNQKPELLLGGDRVLGGLGDAELHYGLGFDLDGFASLRIASHAGLAMRLYQPAQSRDH